MTGLNDEFLRVLRDPNVAFELDRNILGGQALIRITVPGATPRSKRVQELPVIVGADNGPGEDGESHSSMLHRLADALHQVGR